MQFGKLTLKRCKYGWMLFSGPYIGKCFDLYGQYSESELVLMRAFLREGSIVIGRRGEHRRSDDSLVEDGRRFGQVYAIESHPETFNVLCANLALNAVRNTKPLNVFVATGEQVDTGSAVWGKGAYVSERWSTQFVALDALDLPACDLIKVDVDGKELEVLRSGEMQIERCRPILYFENDVQELSSDLLSFAMDTLGYKLYWHLAPIFEENNFFGNPVNHWAPQNYCSLMILGTPSERKLEVGNLRPVQGKNDWWDLSPSSGSAATR